MSGAGSDETTNPLVRTMSRELLSDAEYGRRVRERGRQVIGIRFATDVAAEIERLARMRNVSRGAIVKELVARALESEAAR